MKTQNIRLIDVFVLGPFMVWAGLQLENENAKAALVLSGFATIGYNWNNYLEVRKNGLSETQ